MTKKDLLSKYNNKVSDARNQHQKADTVGQHWLWSDMEIYNEFIKDLNELTLETDRKKDLVKFGQTVINHINTSDALSESWTLEELVDRHINKNK